MLNGCSNHVTMTLDIKDAFLISPQPSSENAYVRVRDKVRFGGRHSI